MISEVGVFVCQLEGKGGEDEVQVAAILEVSRTKEGCSQETIGEDTFGDSLSDRRLPCPGEPVQPEDGGLVQILSPRFDLAQDSLARAAEAASAISMLISGPSSTAAAVQY